jgi:hypothetical protein
MAEMGLENKAAFVAVRTRVYIHPQKAAARTACRENKLASSRHS